MNSQRGFTLIELLIAMVIGLFLVAGALSVFSSVRATTKETTSLGSLQENGRFAVSVLTSDLLRQGFWGEMGTTLSSTEFKSLPAPVAVANDCIGGGVNNASIPSNLGYFRSLWATLPASQEPMNCITDAKIGSDVIQIKRAQSEPVLSAEVVASDYYVKSSMVFSAMFRGSDPEPELTGAKIWPYQHLVYYIRDDQIGGESVPVLMQGRLDNGVMRFDPIVDGIEHLHFEFGIDTDSDGNVNMFIPTESMSDALWDHENDSKIIAVKLYVLARDVYQDRDYSNNNSYQLGNRTLTFNGDNYRRLLFSTTINLFNARVEQW